MSFLLVDSGWEKLLSGALQSDQSGLHIVCPFIKSGAARRMLGQVRPQTLKVVTRFNLGDFAEGVSDLSALEFLLKSGARIRGIKNLHTKLYVVGESRAILTSANLTDKAFQRNHELGVDATDAVFVGKCQAYFDRLWRIGARDLTREMLDEWCQKIREQSGKRPRQNVSTGLPDEGADAGVLTDPIVITRTGKRSGQSFVKFFGESHRRAPRSMPVIDEVKRSGCHWACTYPAGKRPRSVKDGASLFMGRLVEDPDDILIYGRAVGTKHVPGRDEASADDIKLRDWKEHWPHYVRVDDAEFVSGVLSDAVSLNELMQALGPDSFAPTQRNAERGSGNTNPRRAYLQQAAVELTGEAHKWLDKRLNEAFAAHGKLSASDLAKLDWPKVEWAKYRSAE